MMKQFVILTPLIAGLCQASTAWAEAPKKPEEDVLQKRAEAFVQAFNKGDAKAVASFFTRDGDLIDLEGRHLKGRKAIEGAYQKFFAEAKGSRLYIQITSLRVVKPDLALEDGLTEVVPGDGGPPSAARYALVHVKEDGEWKIESVREAIATPPTNAEHLQDLAFLVGDWVQDEKAGNSRASYTWGGNSNFLVNTFELTMHDVAIGNGVQWIGWDASTKKPRAWSFFSNGGFAEGVWTKDGANKWKITATATTREGKKLTATNVFTKVDNDHFSAQFVDRTIDGKPLADEQPIKMKRVR